MSAEITDHLQHVSAEVAEETCVFNARLEDTLRTLPPVTVVPAPRVRAARRLGKGTFPAPVFLPDLHDLEVPGRAGPVKLRVARPTRDMTPRGVYLHIHGGGWMLGASDLQDPALAELATAVGVVVVSVDYRLAPEHPFPAAIDDCEDAARWLVERGAEMLGAPARFSIGGESAGAHLAVLTLLRLRDHRPGSAFIAANLVFGAFDLSLTPSARDWGDRNLVLSTPIIEHFVSSFLPGRSAEELRAPELSPLYADLRDLPPALFTVGTLDPLLDDSVRMAARWHAAGGSRELRIWPEGVHGFTAFPISLARLADAAQFTFLDRIYAASR
ncbi:MAG: Alpha/beta hydrolase fold-3 domain protein [Myxococcales bacterium]|nr:Alpha/beta hydrolase fold-3 domain protein [Myxococcales bacterium]